MEKITVKALFHKNENRLGLYFPRNVELNQTVRNIPTALWSASQCCWHIANNSHNLNQLFQVFEGKAEIDTSLLSNKTSPQSVADATSKLEKYELAEIHQLAPDVTTKVKQFNQWMKSKRYAESTINTYMEALLVFLRFFHDKKLSELTNNNLIEFNIHYILKRNLSASYQNQFVNGVKLFFKTVENNSLDVELIHRPKREKTLPNVLSKEEVKKILEVTTNAKHKAMLSLIYACGLRSGELLILKPEHVDSKRNLLLVKQAKGRKDRIAPLSQKTIEMLRDYYLAYKPKMYLFEGQTSGEPYDSRSLQKVLKLSLEKSGIKKPVTLHWLRHSYATHLLEAGTDLRYIQEILGHSSSRTTEIYTHVSTRSVQRVVSPFDTL